MNNDIISVQFRPPHVTFTPADVTQVTSSQLIGKLNVINSEDVPGKLLCCDVKRLPATAVLWLSQRHAHPVCVSSVFRNPIHPVHFPSGSPQPARVPLITVPIFGLTNYNSLSHLLQT